MVTPIGLGLAALGRPAYITLGHDADLGADRSVAAVERHAHAVLDAALAAGVRYVDAARSYGKAEEFLASWLRSRAIHPGEVTIGSKWGYRYVADWRTDADVNEVKDHSVEALRRQSEESLELLGDHLDLYQIHSATLETGVLEDGAVLSELVRLRDDRGLVVGLTTSGPRQAETLRLALHAEVDGVNPFSCVEATWNPLEPSAGPALSDAHEAGWGVLVKEAVANGRLAPRERDAAVLDRRRPLDRIAAEHGVGPDAIALAAALAQPWADVVLSGATTEAQLAANLQALEVHLSSGELDALREMAFAPEGYWALRGELPWR
jgi:aryl-alcohol dehydrogenase-like predicted oxidoreductase